MVGFFFIFCLTAISGCGVNKDKTPLTFNLKSQSSNELVILENNEPDGRYREIRKSLFDVSCIRCHNPKNSKRLDLTVKANVLENFDDIIYRMTDAFDMGFDYMPPKGDPVKPEIINELKAWKQSIDLE